jgi:hypothetical protein
LPAAQAKGLPNCVDTGGQRRACFEDVWADGAQYRMVFPQAGVPGFESVDRTTNFYVTAPQTDTPQGAPPNTFPHDHVVAATPRQNHGTYRTHLHGYLVVCSAEGTATGECVPVITATPFGDLALAKTVGGQPLTSVDPIESPANAAFVTLIDTGAVLLGVLNSGK